MPAWGYPAWEWLLCAFVIVFPYGGYPLCLWLWSRFSRGLASASHEAHSPTVAMVVAAYNEEKIIAEKIQNFLDLDYPKNKRTLYIGSDGSTDRTHDIVARFQAADVKLQIFPRMGKANVLNRLVEKTTQEILVFSDANTLFASDALKQLVDPFRHGQVGCVCGRLKLLDPVRNDEDQGGEGFYWKFETWLKRHESRLGLVMGANGGIYALRRSLWQTLPSNVINDDFTASMQVYLQHAYMVYAEQAQANEYVAPSWQSEFRRHIRDGAGHYLALFHLWRLLGYIKKPGLCFVFWGHRVLRWLAPAALLIQAWLVIQYRMLPVFQALFVIELIGVALMLATGIMALCRIKIHKALWIPFYFLMVNTALLVGAIKLLLGLQSNRWVSTERVS